MTLLVTGGTGNLGGLVVARLRAAGEPVRVLSRRPGPDRLVGDLATGEGVDAAVAGVDTVVHCAGDAKHDEATTRTLVTAAARAGVRHLVHISVVGADRVPVESAIDRAAVGYFGAKRAAEEVVAAGGVPWTTLRATQFHDWVLTVVQGMAKLPVVPVPTHFRCQPVEAAEVADRLVDLALGAPAGLVADLGGPREAVLADLMRDYLRAAGRRRLLVPVRVPGKGARAVRAGALLAPDGTAGKRTWEEFLAGRVG